VTEFVFKLHEQRTEIYVTELVFPNDRVSQVLDEIVAWGKSQTPKEALHLVFTVPPGGHPCIIVLGMYNGPLEEGEERFKRFVALGPIHDKSGNMPYPQINKAEKHAAVRGQNRLFRGTFVPTFDKELLSRIEPARQKMVVDHPSTVNSAIILECYNPEKVASVPVDATAYAGRHGNRHLSLVLNWNDDGLTSQMRQVSKDAMSNIVLKDTGAYGNLSDADVGSGAERSIELFGKNYPRLASLKKKYDPENIFNKWFAIRPA